MALNLRGINNNNIKKCMPSDEELIMNFLYNKINGKTVPKDVIILECDLYGEKNPWEIWDEFAEKNSYDEKDLYIFTMLKRKSSTSSRSIRTIGIGSWEGEDVAKEVTVKGTNHRIGFKKRFRFEKSGTTHDGAWIMHEYRIDHTLLTTPPEHNYVLCRFRKNTRHESHEVERETGTRKTRQQEEKKVAVENRPIITLALEAPKLIANNEVDMEDDIHNRSSTIQSVNNGEKIEIDDNVETNIRSDETKYEEQDEEKNSNSGMTFAEWFSKHLLEINEGVLPEEEEITMIPNPFFNDMREKL